MMIRREFLKAVVAAVAAPHLPTPVKKSPKEWIVDGSLLINGKCIDHYPGVIIRAEGNLGMSCQAPDKLLYVYECDYVDKPASRLSKEIDRLLLQIYCP